MFGFKSLSENEHLMSLKKTADELEKTANSLKESIDKFVNKKNDKNRKKT